MNDRELLIKGGRVVDPVRGLDRVEDLAVMDGVVVSPESATSARVIDARGLIVAPGLIDIHVHLREPGGEHKETIATGTAAAVAGGFTAVACMPNTNPPLDTVERVQWVLRRAAETAACRVLPIAAITKGRQGRELVDFAALRRAGAVAFSDDGCGVEDEAVMKAALVAVRRIGAVLIQHCEVKHLAAGGVMHAGPAAEKLGLPGLDPRAEEAMIERDIRLVRETGGRYHVAHISTAGAVELVRQAKAEGLPITAEVCPHHLLLCDEDVANQNPPDVHRDQVRGRPSVSASPSTGQVEPDANYKMNPPLRSRSDMQTCITGLLDGTIDCIVTDHAPHTAQEKATGFLKAPFGIVGLETALPLTWQVLREAGRADWSLLVRLMSVAPMQVLGLPPPTLAPGAPADITLIDPAIQWIVGRVNLSSKSRNTPFGSWTMTGHAVATLVAGARPSFHHERLSAEVRCPDGSV